MSATKLNPAESRVAVVTGGASGLGKACVERFSSQGIRVISIDLKLAAEVSPPCKDNGMVERLAGDVSSETDMQTIAEHIAAKYGRLDIVVNCAGIVQREFIYDPATGASHSFASFTKILQVNTIGTFNVIRVMVPLMAKNEPDSDGQRGVIINTSSILGQEGMAGLVAYSASKSAVAGMTLALAREFGPLGIRVAAILPGLADTPMTHNSQNAEQTVAKTMAYLIVFPKRMLRPEEFAHLAQAIIDNHMINGENIRLDAGLRTIQIW